MPTSDAERLRFTADEATKKAAIAFVEACIEFEEAAQRSPLAVSLQISETLETCRAALVESARAANPHLAILENGTRPDGTIVFPAQRESIGRAFSEGVKTAIIEAANSKGKAIRVRIPPLAIFEQLDSFNQKTR